MTSILTNEKMCGNALLQKRFTENFLTKKMKESTGEIAQYFIENSHAPIISCETLMRAHSVLPFMLWSSSPITRLSSSLKMAVNGSGGLGDGGQKNNY